MRQLTIRKVSKFIGQRLAELSAHSGKSLNTLVLELLEAALGRKRQRLRRYITWSEAEAREFDASLAAQRKLDARKWR